MFSAGFDPCPLRSSLSPFFFFPLFAPPFVGCGDLSVSDCGVSWPQAPRVLSPLDLFWWGVRGVGVSLSYFTRPLLEALHRAILPPFDQKVQRRLPSQEFPQAVPFFIPFLMKRMIFYPALE